jgi:hypothetical protein
VPGIRDAAGRDEAMASTWSRIRSTGRSACPTAKVVTAPRMATRPTAPMTPNSSDRPSAVVSTRVGEATITK